MSLTIVSISIFLLITSIITIQNKQKFYRIFDKESTFERISLWENSIEMVKENFVFGVGAGNWQILFPKYGLDKFSNKEVKNGLTTFQRPHNDFLWVLCEMGIIGLLAYLAIFSTMLYYLFRLLQKFKEHENRWLYSTFFASICGYLLIALLDFPLERIEHQIILYLIFSIVISHYYKNFHTSITLKKLNFKLLVFMFLLFAPLIFSFVVCFNRFSGEYHTQKLYYFKNSSNWRKVIRETDKADNFFYSIDPMSTPIQWYKGVALYSLGDINSAKTSFEKAYSINPNNIHVLNNLASCYESLNNHQYAIKFYLQALSISSDFEESRLNLSAVYYNMKEYGKAFEIIDKCNINSTNTKYKLFLTPILNSWIDDLLSKQNDLNLIKKISEIKTTKDKPVQLYFESKNKRTNFEQYFLKIAKQ